MFTLILSETQHHPESNDDDACMRDSYVAKSDPVSETATASVAITEEPSENAASSSALAPMDDEGESDPAMLREKLRQKDFDMQDLRNRLHVEQMVHKTTFTIQSSLHDHLEKLRNDHDHALQLLQQQKFVLAQQQQELEAWRARANQRPTSDANEGKRCASGVDPTNASKPKQQQQHQQQQQRPPPPPPPLLQKEKSKQNSLPQGDNASESSSSGGDMHLLPPMSNDISLGPLTKESLESSGGGGGANDSTRRPSLSDRIACHTPNAFNAATASTGGVVHNGGIRGGGLCMSAPGAAPFVAPAMQGTFMTWYTSLVFPRT